MRKTIIILGSTILFSVFAFLFGFYFSNYFGVSYAIPVGIDSSQLPSSTFTSNRTNANNLNYVRDALSDSSAIYDNFNVPSNLRTSDNANPLYLLMKNLDVPGNQEQFEILENNPSIINDKGINYILTHGYNTTNTSMNVFSTNAYGSVANNNIKQYITQIALWLYIYENNSSFSESYCANGGCNFVDPSTNSLVTSQDIRSIILRGATNNSFQFLNYIPLLVDSANSYTGHEDSSISSITDSGIEYQIQEDKGYIITDALTPSANSNQANYMYYSVEVNDSNNYGVYIADNENNKITNTSVMNGSFKIVVPLKDDITSMNLTSVEIKVYGHFIVDKGYEYRVTTASDSLLNTNKTQKYSNVLFGAAPTEVVGRQFHLYNFTKISKVDVTDSSELSGASLVITKKDSDTPIESWVSTNTPHYITLDDGDYTLCETTAPEGYELNTECVDFNVENSKIKSVVMENKPVDIPNTSKFQSKLFYLVGIILVTFGLGVVSITLYYRKKKIRNS